MGVFGQGVEPTHGHTMGGKCTREYNTWRAMKARCYDTNNNSYSRYGGRGIGVCERWLKSFENFLEDMGDRPIGMTLDRINNDGDYTLQNCRWATKQEQSGKTTKCHMISIGSETYSRRLWVRELGINYSTARSRIQRGDDPIDTLLRPYGLTLKELT